MLAYPILCIVHSLKCAIDAGYWMLEGQTELGRGRLFSWSTSTFAGLEKIDQWNDVASSAFTPLTISALNDRFDARLRMVSAGKARIATVESQASHVSRGRAEVIAGNGEPYFMLHIQDRGSSVHRQSGKETRIEAGDLAFVDASRPYDVTFDADAKFFVCRLPWQTLIDRFPGAEDFVARRLPVRSIGTQIVRNCVETLWLEGHGRELCDDSLVDELVAENLRFAAHSCMFGETETADVLDRFAQAKRLIEKRLSDADLDVAELAYELGVSVRALQKSFAARGGTPSQYIRALRVRRARQLLQSGSLPITQIAFEVGFCDLNQFGRAFKSETGSSPRSYRRRFS